MIGWVLFSVFALCGFWRNGWPESPLVAAVVTVLLLGAVATELVEYLWRVGRLGRSKSRAEEQTVEVHSPPVDMPSKFAESSWAEHDSILHDLSNAMTASLFMVRDLARTLDKRTEPGLGRAKSLAQALAKELSEIGEQIRCTRQSARSQPIVGEALQLAEPVERCVEIMNRLHPDTVCCIECEPSAKDAVVSIVGGEATLKRIVENLVLNACQAQAGSTKDKPEVSCQIAATEDRVTLIVQDNGPGFPRVILDAFPSQSLSTKPEGTGMGLYGCHQLVVRDGGTLTLTNATSGGARVVISWPKLPATSGTIGTAMETPITISATHPRTEPTRETFLVGKQ